MNYELAKTRKMIQIFLNSSVLNESEIMEP